MPRRPPRLSTAFLLVVLGAGGAFAESSSPRPACFSGTEFGRSECCYGVFEQQACFQDRLSFARCCRPEVVPGSLLVVNNLGELLFEVLLDLREAVESLASGGGDRPARPAASALVLRQLRQTEQVLEAALNASSGEWLASMAQAHHFFLAYFLAQEALRLRLPLVARRSIRRREGGVWMRFARFFRRAIGLTDLCRCMESGEFYSHIAQDLRGLGVGKRSGARITHRMLNASAPEHKIVRAQSCAQTPRGVFLPENTLSLMYTTGCVPGDMGSAILLLQSCVLEKDVERVLLMLNGLFKLSTTMADCHDAEFWSFSSRNIAAEYARIVWELANPLGERSTLTPSVLRRLSWSPRHDFDVIPEPWHAACRPLDIRGGVRIGIGDRRTMSAASIDHEFGPLCTDIGRFWLKLRLTSEQHPPPRVLAIFAVTYPWWPNPWHHLHWWIPALLHLKLSLRLVAEETDIALVFPHEDAEWSVVATTPAPKPERVEPPEWSFLQHSWPRPHAEGAANWRPWRGGLHADVLGWISATQPRALSELHGEAYARVTIGLPPIRFHVQTPGMTCGEVARVKRFVESTPQFTSAAMARGGRSLAGVVLPDRYRVTFLQRAFSEGRVLRNLTSVSAALRDHYGGDIAVKVVRSLSRSLPWAHQYAIVAQTDILVSANGGGLSWLWALPRGRAAVELRAANSPGWLSCSDIWNADRHEIFGGLASLAAVHHLCVRAPAPPGVEMALSDPERLRGYERGMVVDLEPSTAVGFVGEAMNLIMRGPPPCHGE